LLRLFLVLSALLGVSSASAQTAPRPAKKGTKYTVKIDSSPQQAAIYLDDKKYGIVGYTPYTGKLTKGAWTLIIELPGYKPSSQAVTVGSASREFFVPLEKGSATLDVQTASDPNVAGATIYVDGEAKGTAPNAAEVAEGRHLLELKKKDFGDFAQWVTVKAGERVTLTPVLRGNTKGSLLVDSDINGATVVVDGKKLDDTTPAIVDALDEGPHIVEVTKDAGQTWKQTVTVKAGTRTKVSAELKGLAGGTVRVLASVSNAEIVVDGVSRGNAPLDVSGLAPGSHIFTARAKGYADKDQSVDVKAGEQKVIKIDLAPGVSGPAGTLQVNAPAQGATVFVDGQTVGQTPWASRVSAGDHSVVVDKEGFARYEQKVTVAEGGTIAVTAELRPIGGLRFLSSPDGATVLLDGVPIGKTPLVKSDVPVGEHVIAFRADGYREFQQPVVVQGGQMGVLNGSLHLTSELTADEQAAVRKGLSSYGAGTVPAGHVTVDASAGYPYYLELRATTGVPEIKFLAADVAVGFRTFFNNYDFLGTVRARVAHYDPFAAAIFATIGGGGGKDGRNQFTLQAGAIGSILFGSVVTVSGKVYMDLWSDRLCGGDSGALTGTDVCKGTASSADITKARKIHGSDDLGTRDNGVRLYTSIVAEIAAAPWLNFFFLLEGAPFQDQRAAFTNLFTSTLVSDTDPIYNFRAGVTFKF
jgi:hypothetical protein